MLSRRSGLSLRSWFKVIVSNDCKTMHRGYFQITNQDSGRKFRGLLLHANNLFIKLV